MKVLFIRFSSIGDIVLTFPVVTALKEKYPKSHISYLSKNTFIHLLSANKDIDLSQAYNGSLSAARKWIKDQKFDLIIDLHKNIRSISVSAMNAKKIVRFKKLNFRKKLFTSFKIDVLPDIHIVDRYFETLKSLGLNKSITRSSFSVPINDQVELKKIFDVIPNRFYCIALGAKFNTKKIPYSVLVKVIDQINVPIALLGDSNDAQIGSKLQDAFKNKTIVNCAGSYNILQSASILQQSAKLITGDTGLMHIASFFELDIISIWGNTTPKFGMSPYRKISNPNDVIIEKHQLNCRPCSKIGYDKCPKGHFKCMAHEPAEIIKAIG